MIGIEVGRPVLYLFLDKNVKEMISLPLKIPQKFDNFFIIGSILQIITLILFCLFTTFAKGGSQNTKYFEGQYGVLMDVMIMIFVGFSVLFCLLPKYGWSGISFGLVIGAFVYEWSILTNGWVNYRDVNTGSGKLHSIVVDMNLIGDGIFSACSVLIAVAGVLGRTSLQQLIMLAFFMTPAYTLNNYILFQKIGATDTGGTIYIHCFGAFFGAAVSWILGHDPKQKLKRRQKNDQKVFDETPNYFTNIFALMGTLFLWAYYPSFNSFGKTGDSKFRAAFNTQIGLIAAAITSIIASDSTKANKKNIMIHMQTGVLAGGVTLGCLCDHPIEPWGALLLGTLGGITCVLSIKYVTPWLENRFKIHDTCDCMALHGICAILSVFASCVSYQTNMTKMYVQDSEEGGFLNENSNFNSSKQAALQIGGLCSTICLGICFGLVTGIFMTVLRAEDNWYDESAKFADDQIDCDKDLEQKGDQKILKQG